MGKVKVPYYRVLRNGRGFWLPTKRMRELGFKSRPCGVDGPGAWKIATEENARWLRFQRSEEPAPALDERTRDAAEIALVYPRSSIGEAFQRYLRTLEWSSKAASTRSKVWWPAWLKRIKPVLAEVRPDDVTMEDLSEWRAACEERYGRDAAHKAVKVWRSFWKVMVAMGYANKADPSLAIRNRAPRPRSDRYREGEVVRLAKAAWSNGYRGLACIIAVCWDTQFSPGDVRKLAPRHAILSDKGPIFDLTVDGRSKTGTAAIGTLAPQHPSHRRLPRSARRRAPPGRHAFPAAERAALSRRQTGQGLRPGARAGVRDCGSTAAQGHAALGCDRGSRRPRRQGRAGDQDGERNRPGRVLVADLRAG